MSKPISSFREESSFFTWLRRFAINVGFEATAPMAGESKAGGMYHPRSFDWFGGGSRKSEADQEFPPAYRSWSRTWQRELRPEVRSASPRNSCSCWASEFHPGRSDAIGLLLPQDHNAAPRRTADDVCSQPRADLAACDYLVAMSARLQVLCVFVMMEVGRTAMTISERQKLPHSSGQSGQFVLMTNYTPILNLCDRWLGP